MSQWQSDRCELLQALHIRSLIYQKFYKVNPPSMLSSVWGEIGHFNVTPLAGTMAGGVRECPCWGCKWSVEGWAILQGQRGRLKNKEKRVRWGEKARRWGAAVNKETGLMAEPTAGSLGSGEPINKHVTVINIAWQVISTVTHVLQGHCWQRRPLDSLTHLDWWAADWGSACEETSIVKWTNWKQRAHEDDL